MMSWSAIKWAWAQDPKATERLTAGTLQLVLVAVADRADHQTWEAHPSEVDTSRRTKLDTRTVRRALGALIAQGLLEDTGQRWRNGRTKVLRVPGQGPGSDPGHRLTDQGHRPRGQGHRPGLSNGTALNRTEPGPASHQETGTPPPDQVPQEVRRAVWRGGKRIPEGPLTPEQLEARRQEQLARLRPLVEEQTREQPDG